MPDVSVVIPTAGLRPESLVRAVRSVAAQQTNALIEVMVVVDSGRTVPIDALQTAAGAHACLVLDNSDQVCSARQAGSEAARGKYIAYLDDDDIWHSSKLGAQIAAADALADDGRVPVIATRVAHVDARSGARVEPIPHRAKDDEEGALQYLFLKRKPRVGRASLYTSTFLVRRDVLQVAEWRRIPRHQDWDWVLQLEKEPNIVIRQLDQVLVDITVGSPGSISAKPDWHSSLIWAKSALRPAVDAETYTDFLFAQPLRYALAARSGQGVRDVMAEALSTRRFPSAGPLAIALAGIMPRRGIERLMTMGGHAARLDRTSK
ncbi:glycosyltransferase family 2 protein [Microbacterium aurantiacum]|uniref:glycosyltransferase family 2 protein n=1 Tax=Microbacterium aurantiacum TaxID=162393 RepID=UPI003F490BC5